MQYEIHLSEQELAELDAILNQQMVEASLDLTQVPATPVRGQLEHRAEVLKHLRKEIENARGGVRV